MGWLANSRPIVQPFQNSRRISLRNRQEQRIQQVVRGRVPKHVFCMLHEGHYGV